MIGLEAILSQEGFHGLPQIANLHRLSEGKMQATWFSEENALHSNEYAVGGFHSPPPNMHVPIQRRSKTEPLGGNFLGLGIMMFLAQHWWLSRDQLNPIRVQ